MLWVNIPDQENIAPTASTSKRARLMVPLTNSDAEANRNTKVTPVVRCRRRGIRCRSSGEVSSRAANPRTMAAAT
jgi:hypothetical protein